MWNWDYTNVNNGFFKEWSPELAYIVGLFFADGTISNYNKYGKKYVQIKLKSADVDVLQKVADVVGYINVVLNLKDGMSRISMSGDFIWQFFSKLGFDNRKTFIAKVCNDIINRPEIYSHFIRGVFDGDGCISIRNRTYTVYPTVNVVGNYSIIMFIKENFIGYNDYYPYKRIYRINYDGANAVKFLNEVYKDSTIHMDRKYNEYLKIKNWETTCKRWTDEEKQYVIDNYLSMYAKDIGIVLNRSLSSVAKCARLLGIKRINSNGKI